MTLGSQVVSDRSLNVIIVGCGNIAGGFDMGINNTEQPCSHAGAYKLDGRYTLQACVEPDDDKRKLFMQYWGVPQGFRTIDEALQANLSIDVVSVCSPTAFHKDDVNAAIQFNPRLIFCEKPVTKSSQQTRQLINACQKAGVLLAVNHTRRWDPDLLKLKQDLVAKTYGELRSVVGFYNKGTLNNGSHLIDLLHFLLGDLEIIATGEGVIDLSPDDPTIPALLRSTGGVMVHMVAANANDYSLFELQLICSNRVLTMRDGGMSWHTRKPESSSRFNGYRVLDAGMLRSGGYPKAMTRAVANIYQALVGSDDLASSGDSAYKAQKMCEDLVSE
jgi:predicted dehydrogenase